MYTKSYLILNNSLLTIIGVSVLIISTIGFGSSLTTNPEINRIGGSDNNVVSSARGNVTALAWTEEVYTTGEVSTKQIIFTVWNEDPSNAHTFQVCAVLEAPALTYQPPTGAAPGCASTSSIPALSSQSSLSLNFTNPVKIYDIVDLSFSIEELS